MRELHAHLKHDIPLAKRLTVDYFSDKEYDKVLEKIDEVDEYFSNQIQALHLASINAQDADASAAAAATAGATVAAGSMPTGLPVHLPEINIPTFNSDYSKWIQFS